MIPIISIIISIGLPILAVCIGAKLGRIKFAYLYSIGSFTACAAGILAEILTIKRRLFAGDIGGIEDTINGVLVLCIVQLVITVALNLILLSTVYAENNKDKE